MEWKKRLVKVVCCLVCTTAFSDNIAINAKRESSQPITRLQIFSERCSGCNYVTALLAQNFEFKNFYPLLERKTPQYLDWMYEPTQIYTFQEHGKISHQLFVYPYGHKHFSPWLCLDPEDFLGPRHFYDFAKSDDCLFVVIFRDPYDWIRSLYQNPWHVVEELRSKSFQDFIRFPWEINTTDPDTTKQYLYNPLLDCDPVTGLLFKNVFKLRSRKIENMLAIRDKVKNIYYVNYETVRDKPYEFLEEIAQLYNLPLKGVYHNVETYKGDSPQGQYKKKKYPPLTSADLAYINEELDPELEALLGYKIKTCLTE